MATARWLIDAAKALDAAGPDDRGRAEVTLLLSLIRIHAREHPPPRDRDDVCPLEPCASAVALAHAILGRD
jgi:hypothetical protein